MGADDRLCGELIRLVEPRRGHFALESGHHGDLWLDLDRLFLAPGAIAPFVSHLAERLSPFAPGTVCGPLIGGAFLAQLIASELDLAFCYTERRISPHVPDGGVRRPVAYHLPAGLRDEVAGKRIAVVDDAINAGHAVRGTLAALRAGGAEPVAIGALLVLEASGSPPPHFDGLPLTTGATLPSALWRAAECPLCARGVPLERPGG